MKISNLTLEGSRLLVCFAKIWGLVVVLILPLHPKLSLIWNASSSNIFFIYFGTFWVEKLELLTCRIHFRGRYCFGYFGSRTIFNLSETINICLGQNFASISLNLSMLFYTSIYFRWCKNHLSKSSYAKVMPPSSWPILLSTMVLSRCHINFHYPHVWR
jgi:hypothetical protein